MLLKGLGHACFTVSDGKHAVLFTMGIDDTVNAVDFLKPKAVVPTHYSAFEPLRKDPNEFAQKVAAMGVRCVILRPGEEGTF